MKTIQSIAFPGAALCMLLAAGASCATAHTDPSAKAKPAATAQPATSQSAGMSAVECEVWSRERSFAASVAQHDTAAFADHVQLNAAFNAGSPDSTHGREAVVAAWKDIIDGTQIELGWSPGVVTVGGDGNMAISRGPAWIENPKQADMTKRYRIGGFISTWIRDKDGQWRVLFDGGGAPMHPASADDVQKLIASLPKECPRAQP